MKLHQLRYFVEIVRQGLNISKAAQVLCTSQSGISKQIQLLEHELGTTLFARKGRNLIALTDVGHEILTTVEATLQNVEDISRIAEQYNNHTGAMTVATTHTQARYVLPYVVDQFVRNHAAISLNLLQGTPDDVATRVVTGEADIAIATEALEDKVQLVCLPCYRWTRCVIVKRGHPLVELERLTLDSIVAYPIITYVLGFTGRHMVDQAFSDVGLEPNIVLKAVDADVIKTYVRLGMGIGIIANMAFNVELDNDLVALDASHLFGVSTTYIAFKKDRFISNYIFRFIALFSPYLTEQVVNQAIACHTSYERREYFKHYEVPVFHSIENARSNEE